MGNNEISLIDTHNLMCNQLYRLSNASAEELSTECERAKAMTSVMSTIIENGKTILKAQELIGEYSTSADVCVPGFLAGSNVPAINGGDKNER